MPIGGTSPTASATNAARSRISEGFFFSASSRAANSTLRAYDATQAACRATARFQRAALRKRTVEVPPSRRPHHLHCRSSTLAHRGSIPRGPHQRIPLPAPELSCRMMCQRIDRVPPTPPLSVSGRFWRHRAPGVPRPTWGRSPPRCEGLPGRKRIPLLNGIPNHRTAGARRQVVAGFDLGYVGGESLILHGFAKPAGIVSPAQMREPGRIVDPIGARSEEVQGLGPEVEGALRASDIHALVHSEVALSVLALVTTAFGPSRGAPQAKGVGAYVVAKPALPLARG